MRLAIDENNIKILASPGVMAFCPGCKERVIPKCGNIYVHHFAHFHNNDCDVWGEEGEWHLKWKSLFPIKNQEIWMGIHRADIKTDKGVIIELQSSPISVNEIEEREDYYENMVWMINGFDFFYNFDFRNKENYHSFRWKRPRQSWFWAQKPIFIDFGEFIFYIRKLYPEVPCGGWGVKMNKYEFLKKINNISKV